MSENVTLPALGESVTEGTVTRWLKNVGDTIAVDEPLVEISTDKVDTEIPSPVAGVIEQILVQEDETVEVGAPLAVIGDGAGAAESAPSGDSAAEAAAPAAEPSTEQPQPSPAEARAEAPTAPAPAAAPSAPAPAVPTPSEPTPAATAPAPATPAPAAPAPATSAPPAAPAPAAPAPAAPAPAAPAAAAMPEQTPAPEPAPAAAAAPAAPAPAPAPAPAAAGQATVGSGYVTPLVRQLAQQHGVDLASVTPTGIGGRITKQDVLDAAAASASPAPSTPSVSRKPEVSPLRGTTVPMTRLRRVIAERAVASMQSTAQLTTVVEVDVTAVANLRDRVKQEFLAKTGNKLNFMPFFAMAAVEALASYPIVNATVDGDSIVYPPSENLSIAVDTERGLLTPVIRDAGALDIAGLAAAIADLAARTRSNQLKPDELSGGTFTLTNTGSRGALFDTPVVFLPQSAILGTGVVVKRPVVVEDSEGGSAIAVRSMVYLALSYDHRIIDGADAARFLSAMKVRLEAADFSGSLGI